MGRTKDRRVSSSSRGGERLQEMERDVQAFRRILGRDPDDCFELEFLPEGKGRREEGQLEEREGREEVEFGGEESEP